jgi:hypothetical protein
MPKVLCDHDPLRPTTAFMTGSRFVVGTYCPIYTPYYSYLYSLNKGIGKT